MPWIWLLCFRSKSLLKKIMISVWNYSLIHGLMLAFFSRTGKRSRMKARLAWVFSQSNWSYCLSTFLNWTSKKTVQTLTLSQRACTLKKSFWGRVCNTTIVTEQLKYIFGLRCLEDFGKKKEKNHLSVFLHIKMDTNTPQFTSMSPYIGTSDYF